MSRRVYFGLYGTFYLAIDHSIIAFYCSTAKPFYTTTKICRKKVFASLIVTRSRSFSKKVFWYLFCSCFVVLDYFIIISLSRTCNLRLLMLNLLYWHLWIISIVYINIEVYYAKYFKNIKFCYENKRTKMIWLCKLVHCTLIPFTPCWMIMRKLSHSKMVLRNIWNK